MSTIQYNLLKKALVKQLLLMSIKTNLPDTNINQNTSSIIEELKREFPLVVKEEPYDFDGYIHNAMQYFGTDDKFKIAYDLIERIDITQFAQCLKNTHITDTNIYDVRDNYFILENMIDIFHELISDFTDSFRARRHYSGINMTVGGVLSYEHFIKCHVMITVDIWLRYEKLIHLSQ